MPKALAKRKSRLKNFQLNGRTKPTHSTVSLGADEIVTRAVRIFGSETAALEWLSSPSKWLDDRSPLQAIDAGQRDDVDRYLGQVEYGVYV